MDRIMQFNIIYNNFKADFLTLDIYLFIIYAVLYYFSKFIITNGDAKNEKNIYLYLVLLSFLHAGMFRIL